MFTTYFSRLEEFVDLPDYNAILEILLALKIQSKLKRDKKAQKIMISISSANDEGYIDRFIDNYYGKKKVEMGIINLPVSTKGVNWNLLSKQEKKEFLMEKWKLLFENLSDDYFLVDKTEVIQSLEKLKNEEWEVFIPLFKKKLNYNKESYDFSLHLTPEKTDLCLLRLSDNRRFLLKSYESREIRFESSFKSFNLSDDILILENNSPFLEAEIFDLNRVL